MGKKQQDRKTPDLPGRYFPIGISAVAASVRYQGGREAPNAFRDRRGASDRLASPVTGGQRGASSEVGDTTTSDIGTEFKKAIGRAEAGRIPWIISTVLGRTDLGSLNGLVEKLQQGGLAGQVASWLGSGRNRPVTAEQLRASLGEDHVQQIARQLRVPVDEALALLCETLPCAVDRASPSGSLPPGA